MPTVRSACVYWFQWYNSAMLVLYRLEILCTNNEFIYFSLSCLSILFSFRFCWQRLCSSNAMAWCWHANVWCTSKRRCQAFHSKMECHQGKFYSRTTLRRGKLIVEKGELGQKSLKNLLKTPTILKKTHSNAEFLRNVSKEHCVSNKLSCWFSHGCKFFDNFSLKWGNLQSLAE